MSLYNDYDSIANFNFTFKDLKESLIRNNISPTDANIKKFLCKYKEEYLSKPVFDFAHASMDDILYDMKRLNILKG